MTDEHNHHDDVAAPSRTRRARALPALSLLVAILIAAVLQFAGAAKVASGADDLRRLKDSAARVDHGLPPSVSHDDFQFLLPPGDPFTHGILLDFAVAFAEFALVVLVLAAHRTRAVWLLVPLVFATFAGYGLQRLLHGLPCGCFGDLWHPPDGLTLTLDILFVVAAIAIAAIRGATPKVIGATLLLSIAGAAGGYIYSTQTAPPAPITTGTDSSHAPSSTPSQENRPNDAAANLPAPQPAPPPPDFDPSMSAPEKLLASDLMADVRDVHAAGDPTAYYVFIWDPTCTTCERLKPIVEHYKAQFESEGNPFLQVLLFQKQNLRDSLAIQPYEWESSPVVFLVRPDDDSRSTITDLPGGDDAPLPDQILESLTSDEPLP